jgi:uncharacterized protein HemY
MESQERIEQFRTMITNNPDSELLHFSLGNEYLKAGRLEKATESFRATLHIQSEYTAAYRQLGKALEQSGNTADARQAYMDGIIVGEKTGDLQVVKEMQVFLRRLDKTMDDSV